MQHAAIFYSCDHKHFGSYAAMSWRMLVKIPIVSVSLPTSIFCLCPLSGMKHIISVSFYQFDLITMLEAFLPFAL